MSAAEATEPEPAEPEDAVKLAIRLLAQIAEDATLRPSHRITASRHLGRLRQAAERPERDAEEEVARRILFRR